MIEITPTPNISAWLPWLICWQKMEKSGFPTPWSSSLELVLQVSIYLKKKKKSPHFGAKSGAPLPPKNDDFRSYYQQAYHNKPHYQNFGWFHIPDMYWHDLRREL